MSRFLRSNLPGFYHPLPAFSTLKATIKPNMSYIKMFEGGIGMVKYSKIVTWLVGLIAVLALMTAGAGVFWQGSDPHTNFVTQRGQTVSIQNSGLYKYDSVLSA